MVDEENLVTVFMSKSEKNEAGINGLAFKKISLVEYRKTVEIGTIFHGDVYFDWSAANGFGQLSFSFDRETQHIQIMNECMSRDVVRQLLYAFVDKLVDSGNMDCDRG